MSIHFIEMYNDDDGDQINEKKHFLISLGWFSSRGSLQIVSTNPVATMLQVATFLSI